MISRTWTFLFAFALAFVALAQGEPLAAGAPGQTGDEDDNGAPGCFESDNTPRKCEKDEQKGTISEVEEAEDNEDTDDDGDDAAINNEGKNAGKGGKKNQGKHFHPDISIINNVNGGGCCHNHCKPSVVVRRIKRNWKECAWNKLNNNLKVGAIKNCRFTKKYKNSYLRVSVASNMAIKNCDNCCKRWFVTFNSKECAKIPIDGLVKLKKGTDSTGAVTHELYRPRVIEGNCQVKKAGLVNVKFNVGKCDPTDDAVETITGYESSTRIIIEEIVDGPQK